MERKETGHLGENIAVEFLKKRGYQVLDRNYSVAFSGLDKGEIDIVAAKNGIISFVEVKTGEKDNQTFSPEEKVDFRKQKKLIKLGQSWLIGKKIPLDAPWQIDVVGIRLNLATRKARIYFFTNICSA